jgi:hypothetical protein
MDFGTTLKHIAPFAIPLLALCIPIVALLIAGIVRIKGQRQLHETIRHMAEKGLPVPEELINAVVSGNVSSPKTWSPTSQLRSGIINIFIGLGLMVLLLTAGPTEWLWWGIGALPFIIGIGFLVIWRIESKKS